MDAAGEFVDICALSAEVEDTDLGVGNTTVEARFGIRLQFESTLASEDPRIEFCDARRRENVQDGDPVSCCGRWELC